MKNRNPFFLKSYFLVALIAIALASFLYIQDIIFKLEETSVMQTRIFARFSSNLGDDANIDEIIFEEIIKKIRFPVIVTDTTGMPVAWRNIGKYDKYFQRDLTEDDMLEMDKIVHQLDRENQPVEIKFNDRILAVVHYGEDSLYKRLQFAPFFQLLVAALFLIIGVYGYMLYRRSEENFIWAGMAKETAHQIGTPLSSLYGWLEIMKTENIDSKLINGLEEDAKRLDVIATRFNKIGSPLAIELVNVNEMMQDTIDYFSKRVPSRGTKRITFEYKPTPGCFVPCDRELLKWSFENLIRNSIDALRGREDGRIDITTEILKHQIKITVKDNGRGIEKKNMEYIFNAGFSTKEHGWGIGLPLTKKIIEEFHKGKLYLEYTMKDQGTMFSILLPRGQKDETENTVD